MTFMEGIIILTRRMATEIEPIIMLEMLTLPETRYADDVLAFIRYLK